ncbi:16S rRNA (uracil(1498)-N(3))-methyltransferase [Sneathiella sp. P13V-1]|uniref:16S rRNA (uracil(1498)-N(3))-methyltransferase n=1 Tax=Sneathiella sp. P13V-1 TaxID=2697366 RepID=UPI00187B512D|nr:16S rRNA (uracil(1498)-N(3))-methyltransferase [Sneathiella sp. P13V-1]MBE7635604.1 16S rRNA (uracil(1498)-N(3))-methyltransferase [Sneathiella sp. P13V-1]
MLKKQNTPRLYVESDLSKDQGIPLGKEQSHYVVTVMRRGEGDELILFNGRDGEWRGVIQQARKNQCLVHVVEQLREQTSSSNIEIAFAPLKKIQNGIVVQKMTELGVSALRPVQTNRTNADRLREDKMLLQVIEAAEQCERLDIPEVYATSKLGTFLKYVEAEGRTLIYCAERSDDLNPVQALSGIEKSEKVTVLIGPEGGFADEELEQFEAVSKSCTLKLGPRILRAETAAISAVTLVQSVLGDW